MKVSLTATDVIREIENELLQGAIVRDQLGSGLRDVQKHNNRTRTELLATAKLDLRDVASRQFQINDMLLTLFHETIAKVQELQLELRKSVQLIQSDSFPLSTTEQAQQTSALAASIHQLASTAIRQQEEIEIAMRQDALALELDARPIHLPLLGGILTRLRNAFHSLTLFYTTRLANRQSVVNRLYGNYILDLLKSQQTQNEELAQLRQQVALLSDQVQALQQKHLS